MQGIKCDWLSNWRRDCLGPITVLCHRILIDKRWQWVVRNLEKIYFCVQINNRYIFNGFRLKISRHWFHVRSLKYTRDNSELLEIKQCLWWNIKWKYVEQKQYHVYYTKKKNLKKTQSTRTVYKRSNFEIEKCSINVGFK